MRKVASLLAVTGLMLAVVLPVGGITGGAPDGTGHPAVGALLGFDESTGDYFFVCSGSLLSDTEFLTAAHCTPWETVGQTDDNVFVSFDEDLRTDDPFQWGWFGPVVHPDHVIGLDLANPKSVMPGYWISPGASQSRNDVAVLHLASPVSDVYPGIQPIELPEVGFLTDAAALGGLVGHRIVNVGYGFVALNVRTWADAEYTGLRMTSSSAYLGLTQTHLVMSSSLAAGQGGVCIGDSGAPNFFAPVGQDGEHLAVAINAGRGKASCGAGTNSSIRLDVPEIASFLAHWN